MPTNTEIIYHPLLPRLKQGSDNKVTNFIEHGVWHQRGLDELDKLSDSLKVERIATQINSIPDVWARPLLFEMALYDSDHLLHKRTVAEWRGLLAALAFKEVAGLNIRVTEAAPEERDNKESWPAFLSILARMAPNPNTLQPNTVWIEAASESYPCIILNNDEPIGLLSPTTLVCTATDCFNRLDGIRWSDGRFLKDPSGKIKESEAEITSQLNQKERTLLAGWLENLHAALSKLSNPNAPDPRLNKLLGLLSSYTTDLGGAAGLKTVLSTTPFGSVKGIFQYFDKPIKGDRDGVPESHLQLLPSEGRTPTTKLFVVDRSIAQQWNMAESNVVVYRGATLADIPSSGFGRERKQIRGIRLEPNEELCLPEDLFTDKIYLIMQESALPGGMASPGSGSIRKQNQVVTPLLPLTEKLLPFLNNEEIQTNLTFEQSSESIIVRLRLRLSGPDSSPKFVELKREYKKHDQITLDSVPVLEIWPNFRSHSWKLYYTYFSKTGENTFYAKPYAGQEHPKQKSIRSERNRIESEISQNSIFPTAVLCYALSPNTSLNRMDEHYAGVILLTIPDMVSVSDKTWNIGVDFGTTSTSVYYAVGENEAEPFVFRKELLSAVTASGSTRAMMYDEFIPGEAEPIPFLSFYQEFREPREGEVIEVISDGHIFFLDNSKEPDKVSQTKNLSTNLKWSGEKLDRQRATAFLEQIVLHILAEAASKGASKFSLRYSYPTAFSQVATSGLPEKWGQIVAKAVPLTGLQLVGSINRKSESHTSAIYFADELKAPTNAGTVCIDIGGGTSDIAIWQNDQLRHQMSLRLAGRELFLNTLFAKPDFVERFGTKTSALNSLKNRRIEFYAQADAIINREGKKWFEQLPTELADPQVKKLVQIIAIGISGLFHYIGLVMKYLIEQGSYKKEIPSFYIGGNGSKMFHWLAAGSYKPESPINELFRDVFENASGMTAARAQQMKFVLSPSPKCEAARGLVGKKELDVALEAADSPAVFSGESILVNGKRQLHNSVVDASLFKNTLEIPAKLDQTESFVEAFNRFAKKTSMIPTIDFISISDDLKKQLEAKLKDIGKKKIDDISVEPLFILSLKTLIEIATDEWKNR